ncbi:MAG: DUF3685 domain-containing protein [Cyanobacteria bacterium P01_H01_bin.15]
MTSSENAGKSFLSIQLIDDDPIYRRGFAAVLAEQDSLQVLPSLDSQSAITSLQTQQPQVLIVGLRGEVSRKARQLCQQLRRKFPALPILLLSDRATPAQARALPIQGLCSKRADIGVLVRALQELGAGDTYWPAKYGQTRTRQGLSQTRYLGLRQIDAELARIRIQVQNPALSLGDWLFWSGRQRELQTARWLIQAFLPVEEVILENETAPTERAATMSSSDTSNPPTVQALVPQTTAPLMPSSLRSATPLRNLTNRPLALDILGSERQQELLNLITERLSHCLNELRALEISRPELSTKLPGALIELWQSATLIFLRQQESLPISVAQLETILQRETDEFMSEVFNRLPLLSETFAHLLFETSLPPGKEILSGPASNRDREELLTENLLIALANAVMQVILNNFSEEKAIAQALYAQRWVSSRELARFRNELSWSARQARLWQSPQDIFESRYSVDYFAGSELRSTYLYVSRQRELTQLRGWGLTVTLILESRDALAPRLQGLVNWTGRGMVYLLTEVIGRGIGLIGRGIILGVGNVLQDVRYRRQAQPKDDSLR